MRRLALIGAIFLALSAHVSYAGFLNDAKKALDAATREEGLSDETVVSGLKEALTVGTRRAVDSVSRADGYFGNPEIRILFPERLRKVSKALRKVGYKKQVDEFVLTMNRAAEKAAPRAAALFIEAVKEMTFKDARKILKGGDTAAAEYFRAKTSGEIYREFRPVVSRGMNEAGVTRSYKKLMKKYASLPLVKAESCDLDHYVTKMALEGLFHMVGEEEKRIRKDPAARATGLLRKIFGRQ